MTKLLCGQRICDQFVSHEYNAPQISWMLFLFSFTYYRPGFSISRGDVCMSQHWLWFFIFSHLSSSSSFWGSSAYHNRDTCGWHWLSCLCCPFSLACISYPNLPSFFSTLTTAAQVFHNRLLFPVRVGCCTVVIGSDRNSTSITALLLI